MNDLEKIAKAQELISDAVNLLEDCDDSWSTAEYVNSLQEISEFLDNIELTEDSSEGILCIADDDD